jgi:hypothetical protein
VDGRRNAVSTLDPLEQVLTGDRAPGVYLWPAAPEIDGIQAIVGEAGWRFIHLDTTTVVDKAGLLDAVAKTFGLPAYLGRGQESLTAYLAEVRDDFGVLVVWEGWAGLAELNPQAARLAIEAFAGRAGRSLGGPFAVLLIGAGPLLDVPSLVPG